MKIARRCIWGSWKKAAVVKIMSGGSLWSTVRSVNVLTEPLRSLMPKNSKYAQDVRIQEGKKLDFMDLSLSINFEANISKIKWKK